MAILALAACGGMDVMPADQATWQLDSVFSVGSLDGPDAFGRIQSIVADEDGRLYVADAQARAIAVFDGTGRRIGVIGRSGRGPGEIVRLQSMAWLGDTLAVMDPGNARIGLFSPDGAWLGQFAHQPLTGPATWIRFHRASQAGAWAMQIDRGTTPPGTVFIRFTSWGPGDTLPRPPPDVRSGSGTVTCPVGDAIRFFEVPFHPQAFFTFTPAGAVLRAWTSEYALAMTTSAGDTLGTVRGPTNPVPIPDATWDSASAEWHAFRAEVPGAQCEGAYERPDRMPALRFAFYDAGGRLWVERYVPDGFMWDVWTDDSLIGTMAAPDRDPGLEPYARGDRLYVVTRDSLGVQRVAAFRVVRDR